MNTPRLRFLTPRGFARPGARRSLALVVAILGAAVVAPAAAAPSSSKDKRVAPPALKKRAVPAIALDRTAMKLRDDAVRQRYLVGKQHVRFGEHAAALKAFRAVYRRQRLADVLFDMAACEAHLGHMRRALALQRRYVRSFKTAVDRAVAVARFAGLVQRLEAARKRRAAASAPSAVSRAPSSGGAAAKSRRNAR